MNNFDRSFELNIQREEKEFFAMMDALPYGITLVEDNKEIYFANKTAKVMMGSSDPNGCIEENCICSLENNQQKDVSRRLLKRVDGSTIPILKSVQTVIFNGKRFFLEVMTDISQQVMTEKKLREKSKELETIVRKQMEAERTAQNESRNFQTLFEELADALFVHDFEGNIIKVNQKACDRLGYSREQFARMNIFDLESPRSFIKTKNKLPELKKKKQVNRETKHISFSGCEIPVEIYSKAIVFEGKEVVLSSSRNISKRKQYEKELIISKKRAEESDRLKSRFLNNISHEIRTPLNGIVGFLNLIEDPDTPADKKREFIEIMRQSSDRLIETVQTIIDISKIESSSERVLKERFYLFEALNEVVQKTKTKHEKPDLEFIWKVSPEIENRIIETNRDNFILVLMHLIGNAYKFTERGSIQLVADINDSDLSISVKDTGIGIHKDEIALIFKPFSKTQESERMAIQGNGLGLTLAVKLAGLLGGNIQVTSEHGKGSDFKLALPNVVVNDLQLQDRLLPLEEFNNKTILIAEDDASNFMYLQALLEEKGCKILHAHNGEQALRMGLNGHKIDLILMDIGMPVMDGITATRKIRDMEKSIPIIAHSAFVLDDAKERALEAGCDDFLTKPVMPDQLIASLRKHLINRQESS